MDLLKLMKRAGCRLIHFGVETGSERIMEIINKKISLPQIAHGIDMTKKAGIDQACFFMFGFPTETEEDRSKTVAFAKTRNPTYASFHKVTTYQGTPLFEMAKTHYNVPFRHLQIEDHETDFLNQTIRQALLEFYVRWQYIIVTSLLAIHTISSLNCACFTITGSH